MAQQTKSLATFAMGCFWGPQLMFSKQPGVLRTFVGFMGGQVNNPSYRQVCYTETGHAEVVQIEFDPDRITYSNLLDLFWKNHDPTQKNRQGPDVGTQYRSAIFYHTPEQQELALNSREQAQSRFFREIVTEIVPATDFWMAEDYHQDYLQKQGRDYCH
eukprot:TRINITY_DN2365_c0_g1_i4.p1 TRINITY_DN2365_c0_g1~~TRINITY_DN2365_c0_g1_i4.p1  ORF type:complete len:159 (+),score=45.63 TRINITY_DN2365_c0_g1_i4:97-573(+)